MRSFNLRSVLCRIRLFPTLISKIKWSELSLMLNEFGTSKLKGFIDVNDGSSSDHKLIISFNWWWSFWWPFLDNISWWKTRLWTIKWVYYDYCRLQMQQIFVVNIPSFQFKMVHFIISRYARVNLGGINLDWT